MIQATIRWLQSHPPQRRLELAAWCFWVSFIGGKLATIASFFTRGWWEAVMMEISFDAITITAAVLIMTAEINRGQ